MTQSLGIDVCRITVVGPARSVDLAVPVTLPVAALLPVLLRAQDPDAGTDDGWVLQRLGGVPFDPAGTPESLDWLEGERLYLRPAQDAWPELDFDDLADGIATVVNRRGDRWRPEYRRTLFLILSGVALVVLAVVLAVRGPLLLTAVAGLVTGTGLLIGAVAAARALTDGALAALCGVGSAAITALTGLILVNDGARPHWPGLVVAAAVAAGVSALLVLVQRVWAPSVTYPPVSVVLVVSVILILWGWIRAGLGAGDAGAAAVIAVVLFIGVLAAPRITLRLAGLRGVQLPKTGEELGYDNQPLPAAELQDQAFRAHDYLSVAVVSAALILPFVFLRLLGAPGWAGWVTTGVLATGLLLRARTYLGIWQRGALTAAGTAGVLLLIVRAAGAFPLGWRIALLTGLVILFAVLVMAALRPWPRRLLPIWEFTATVLDFVMALALLPLVLHLLGAYGWARSLFG